MSLMWCLMPRRDVTSGFFRIQMFVALGLSVLAALTLGRLPGGSESAQPLLDPTTGSILCGVIAVVAYIGSVFWTLQRRQGGAVAAFLVAGLSTVVLVASALKTPSPGAGRSIHIAVNELSSALLLGSGTTTMLLGHWYLTAPTMSIAPLGRLNLFFGASAVLRLVVASVGLAIAWNEPALRSQTILLVLRWLAGIAAPIGLAVMVSQILRFRNTQSATGVLYASMITTFIGEPVAALLSSEIGVPL